MAYMNSGIQMKTTQYNWKIISVILLILASVCVLVVIKLMNPAFNPKSVATVLSAPAVLVSKPAQAAEVVQPKPAIAAVPKNAAPDIHDIQAAVVPVAENKTIHAAVAHAEPILIKPQAALPAADRSEKHIVCSAEDRAAQLCQ